MSNRQHFTKEKNYRVHVQYHYKTLELHRGKDDKRAFYEVFLRIIPQLRNYIRTRLQELVHSGGFPHNFYEVDDFVDDLFISVYENFQEFKNEEDFYMFLFAEIDILLDIAKKEEFKHHDEVEQLDLYTKKERDAMRERFTAELDGDLVMREELDDVSYALNNNAFAPLAQEGLETKINEHIDTEKKKKYTENQINELLKQFPQEHRNIATLYIHFHLTPQEIVKITKLPRVDVKKVLDSIKHTLQRDFFNM